MDDTRPLDGMTAGSGGYRQVHRTDRGENDLEDHGGGGYQPPPRGQEADAPAEDRSEPERSPVSDEPTPRLVQALDRLRTTGEASTPGTDRLRRLRGQKHYRDDPTTAFHRGLGRIEDPVQPGEEPPEPGAGGGDPGSAALERKPPSEPE